MSLPDGWAEHVDAGSGKTFYYKAATGETTWDKPQAAGAAAAGGLPEGWTEHVDPGSGKTFYYKAATGETSWEKPAAAASADKSAAGGLPEGWTEHVDPGCGKTFYYKAATGETSWDKPQAAAAASSPKAAGALPEGWTEHTDPGTGKTFYYKAATGETSWERPAKQKEEKTRAASFEQVARSIGAFLDEAKAAKTSFTQQEEQALAAVLAQHSPNVKQAAQQTFTAVSAAAAKLLPLAQAGAVMPPDALGELNHAVTAFSPYGVAKSEAIPPNLLNAAPGSKMYPGLVKKVEALCVRTMEQWEQRENDSLKGMLTKGGADPGFDAQKADIEARTKQMMQSLHQKHAPILAESDHVPVLKTLPAGAKAVSAMCWNVMEFPRGGRAPGQEPIIEGLVPLCDLVIKHLGRKDDRMPLLEAMTSEAVILQHSTQTLNVVRDALEARGMEIVMLQEIGGDMQAKMEDLCRQKGWASLFAPGNADPNKCDAIAGIISNRPFEEQMQVQFQEETSKKIRIFPAVRQGTAWLISCHVPLGKQTTEDQKQGVGVKLIQEMSQRFFRAGTVLIIGGDWNADVNGIKNKTEANIPYGCSSVSVFTDSQTTHGAAFPVDGMLCLQ